MYQLRITIEGITPPIWRTMQVSEHYSFYKLHHIIQKIFGWKNSHIWCFLVKGEDTPITNPWLWGGGTTRWDKTVKLKTFLKKEGDMVQYEYDPGDSWQHSIVLERVTDERIRKPLCTDGRRACPPEDCGGIDGYRELIRHLLHPEEDGYFELLEWLDDDFDPEAFDLKESNRELKGLNFYIRIFDEENGLIFSDPKKSEQRLNPIQINESDVKMILQDEYPAYKQIVAGNIYCNNCTGKHRTTGITDYIIILNNLNDIQLRGKCSICGGLVGRYMEFGEIPEINRRARAFRDTFRNRKSMKVVDISRKGP